MKCPICGEDMEFVQYNGLYFYECPVCKIWEDAK